MIFDIDTNIDHDNTKLNLLAIKRSGVYFYF